MRFAENNWNFLDRHNGASAELKTALDDAVSNFMRASGEGDRSTMRELRQEAREIRQAIREERKDYIDGFKAARDDAKAVREAAKEEMKLAREAVREARDELREARKAKDADAIAEARLKLAEARAGREEARDELQEARADVRTANEAIREARDAWRDGREDQSEEEDVTVVEGPGGDLPNLDDLFGLVDLTVAPVFDPILISPQAPPAEPAPEMVLDVVIEEPAPSTRETEPVEVKGETPIDPKVLAAAVATIEQALSNRLERFDEEGADAFGPVFDPLFEMVVDVREAFGSIAETVVDEFELA